MCRHRVIATLVSALSVVSWSCNDSGDAAPAGSDTASGQSSDRETDTPSNEEVNTDTGTETETATEVDTGVETGADAGNDTGSETGKGSGSDTSTDREWSTGADTQTESGESTDTDSDTDTRTDTASAGDSETDTESASSLPAWVDTDFETDPSAVILGGPCPADRHIGGFKVEMNAEVGYTAIDGTVYNGVDPALVPDVALEEGDCRLLKRRRLICDPPCASGTTCTPEATCEAMPMGQDVGIALFQGLVKTVFVEPVQPGNTYFYTRLDHPGFANGDVIRLTTSGGYIDAFELYGVGVEPLHPAKDQWVLEEGHPLVIEWPAPPEGARSTMRVTLNIDQHGLTPVTLVCDLEDTGSATLPSSVIDALIQSGVTGFPSATAVRRTVDSLDGEAGCVEFQVASVSTADVEVTGYIPCTSNENCPDPLTCNREIQQCQ
jgi:hypothetical protein